MSIEDAVALALDEDRQPVIYSDAGDNPGGGGEGRTTWLLSALVRAGAKGVLFGSFSDQGLAAESHNLGKGAKFDAVFSRTGDTEFSKRFSVPVEVLALHQGDVVGSLGIYEGRKLSLGLCAALRIGGECGITVTVISVRKQNADPVFFEMFGLDIARAHTVCVKSRGHFRAGYIPWFPAERVYEVDTPGLTSPVLSRFTWRNLPRPVYPLDLNASWLPPD